MKVAIITFHRATNYGAVLQAYALQKAVEQLGNSCVVLDYLCPTLEEYTSAFSMFEKKHTLKNYVVSSIKTPFRYIRRKRFKDFRMKYLTLSKQIYDIQEVEDKFDCFISGSDQVWNDYLTGNDATYFLDHVRAKSKKNSYAACFGYTSLPQRLIENYREHLAEFKNISVRDETSKKLIQELLGEEKAISVVADPTLLWTESFWQGFCKKKYHGKYILVYSLNKEIGLMQCAKKLSEKYNMDILYICNDIFEIKKYSYVKHIFSPKPDEFISLIANAEYVVTNSFHGTVFSLIFHRKFYCETYYGDKTNKRIEDLLAEVNCSNHIMTSDGTIKEDEEPQWDIVDNQIEKMRTNSISYLEKIMN